MLYDEFKLAHLHPPPYNIKNTQNLNTDKAIRTASITLSGIIIFCENVSIFSLSFIKHSVDILLRFK